MPDKLTHQHACNTIISLYRNAGFEAPDKPLGEEVATEFRKDIKNTPLAALYAFVDEQIALLRLASFYFLSTISDKENIGRIFYKLTIKQIKTLASIRLLCTYGLDVNARMQLRLLYETSVLWSRLRVDKQARDDFVLANNTELSNAFWHKYISKSKTEKFLDKMFSENGNIWLGGANPIIEELKRKIGPSSHPSFLSTYFDTSNDSEDNVALSDTKPSSHFTLSLSILAVSIPFSLKPEPTYDLSCINMFENNQYVPPLNHPNADWDEYSQKVRDMIPTLVLMAVRFTEGLKDSQ